jgi:hypothetical protein
MSYGTPLAMAAGVTKSTALLGSALLAGAIGVATFLRPRPVAHDELPAPASMPPALVHVVRVKMDRHGAQMKELVARVVLLDDDGVARAAGAMFDEPALARPLAGDELNGALPERFFILQDELRKRARQLVVASGQHDRAAVAAEFAALSKTCLDCHQVYLHGDRRPSTFTEDLP